MFINYEDEEFKNVDAVAILRGDKRQNSVKGLVRFYQTENGVYIVTYFNGLKNNDIYLARISESDSFKSEYNIFLNSFDLPPIIMSNGIAMSSVLTNRFSINDVIGKCFLIEEATLKEKIAYGYIK